MKLMKKYIIVCIVALHIMAVQPANAADSFTIRQGWNLLNSEVVLNYKDELGKFVVDDGGGALYVLNNKDKKYYGGSGNFEIVWNTMEQNSGIDHNDLFASGWWVYAPKDISIDVNPKARYFNAQREIRERQSAYQFVKGWNFIGLTSVMKNKPLIDVKGSCEFVSAYGFGSNLNSKGERIQDWQKLLQSDFEHKFKEDQLGIAIAVKVSNDCKFNFENSSPPPALPNY